MTLYLSAAAVLLASLLATTVAIRVAQVAHAQLDAARLELGALRARVAAADADVVTALGRLDELHQLRVDDVQRMRADVRELRDNYERVMREHERRHGPDGPPASTQVH